MASKKLPKPSRTLGGIEIVEDNRADVIAALMDARVRCLAILGLKAERYAKKNITEMGAVDTGNLRNSITFATGEEEVSICAVCRAWDAEDEAKTVLAPCG